MGLTDLLADMSQGTTRPTPLRYAVVVLCVLVVAVALTWTFLGMRAVMDVGGSCAEGGPYEIAQPCPDGAVLLSAGIPLLMVGAMLGSVVAALVGAPNLLVPMWGFLFGSLGWNFLEYGFSDSGTELGFVVPGVMFEAMALPAFAVILFGDRIALVPRDRSTQPPASRLSWYLGYLILGIVGLVAGTWTFDALA